jgi:hypothetical protein
MRRSVVLAVLCVPACVAGGCEQTLDVVSLGDGGAVEDGGTRAIPDYTSCVGLSETDCFACCVERFDDPVPPQATERWCLCVEPRPCGDLCDPAHCGEEPDLTLESEACLECRLRVSEEGGCEAQFQICRDDPYCAAWLECSGACG